jgi:hypothetical protein
VAQSDGRTAQVTTPLGDFRVAGSAEVDAFVALFLRPEHLHSEGARAASHWAKGR